MQQFCEIVEESFTIDALFPASVEVNGEKFQIYDVVKNKHIRLSDTNTPIPFTGFEPRVKLNTDWSDFQECFASTLWNDKVGIVSLDHQANFHFLEEISKGQKSYDLDLLSVERNDFVPVKYNLEGSQIRMLSTFAFRNLNKIVGKNLAFQRIPKHCKLMLLNAHLGFDPTIIMNDLKHLQVHIETTRSYLAKSYILHNHFIDQVTGAQCSIYQLSKTLKQVEFLSPDSSLDDLSLTSQTAIVDYLKKAQQLGAFQQNSCSSTADGLWAYFSSAEKQKELEELCKTIKKNDNRVSTSPFLNNGQITNQDGFRNALEYEQKKTNLRTFLTAAWGLASIGKYEVKKLKELNWLLDASIYHHLF